MGLVVSRPWPSQLIQAVERASQEAKQFLRGAGSPWIVPRESKARLKPTLQCLSFMLLKKRMWFNVTPLWMVLELAFFRMAIQWHIHLESSLPLRSTTPKFEKNCYQLSSTFERCLYRGKVFIQTDHKPLKSIMKKSLLSTPKRLQRMLLRLQKSELTVRAPRCLLQIR